jgi:outer membrane protein
LKVCAFQRKELPSHEKDQDDSFGFHLNAGLEFVITDNFALDLDLKYVWSEADFDLRDSTGVDTGEIDLNGFVVGISLKYCF